MTEKKRIGLIFCFIILFIILFVGYISIHYIYQEYVLRKEVNNLTKLDITKDKFNKDIVTIGDYRIVESSIKNYLNDFAVNLQNVNNIVSNDIFKQLLSYDNLSKDVDFEESIEYVIKTKDEFNTYIDNLITMCSESNIKSNITKNDLNIYYINLYNDLMFNAEVINKLNLSQDYLEEYRQNMNLKLDACLEIFTFLNTNQNNYKFQDGKIKFSTEELLNQYNAYIEKINQ